MWKVITEHQLVSAIVADLILAGIAGPLKSSKRSQTVGEYTNS
jgi:hypothetical protein